MIAQAQNLQMYIHTWYVGIYVYVASTIVQWQQTVSLLPDILMYIRMYVLVYILQFSIQLNCKRMCFYIISYTVCIV